MGTFAEDIETAAGAPEDGGGLMVTTVVVAPSRRAVRKAGWAEVTVRPVTRKADVAALAEGTLNPYADVVVFIDGWSKVLDPAAFNAALDSAFTRYLEEHR